jgi:hypothetical protein
MEAEEGVTGEVVEVTDSGEVVGVTDSAVQVLAAMGLVPGVLAVMVSAHPGRVSMDARLVRDSTERVDLRVEVFLTGRTAVDSGIAVSVGEIVGFAISKGTLLILASMVSDIQITTNTTTPITTHTRITTTMAIQALTNPETTEDRELGT